MSDQDTQASEEFKRASALKLEALKKLRETKASHILKILGLIQAKAKNTDKSFSIETHHSPTEFYIALHLETGSGQDPFMGFTIENPLYMNGYLPRSFAPYFKDQGQYDKVVEAEAYRKLREWVGLNVPQAMARINSLFPSMLPHAPFTDPFSGMSEIDRDATKAALDQYYDRLRAKSKLGAPSQPANL